MSLLQARAALSFNFFCFTFLNVLNGIEYELLSSNHVFFVVSLPFFQVESSQGSQEA